MQLKPKLEFLDRVTIEGEFPLEAIIEGAKAPKFGAVICHPHPMFKGNMEDNVVIAVKEAVVEQGGVALRFNFRGVGKSGGEYSGGRGEINDAKSALEFLTDYARRIWIIGYSFGSWVGFKAGVELDIVEAMIGIAPPTTLFDFSFMLGVRTKVGIIAGTKDPFCPDFQTVFRNFPIETIGEADHLMVGFEDDVKVATKKFIRKFL